MVQTNQPTRSDRLCTHVYFVHNCSTQVLALEEFLCYGLKGRSALPHIGLALPIESGSAKGLAEKLGREKNFPSSFAVNMMMNAQ